MSVLRLLKKMSTRTAGRRASDTSEHCGAWKETGECANNAAYMNTACPKSCGHCATLKKRVCKVYEVEKVIKVNPDGSREEVTRRNLKEAGHSEAKREECVTKIPGA